MLASCSDDTETDIFVDHYGDPIGSAFHCPFLIYLIFLQFF